jgi:AhpD family alkylhydroperoxidase
VTHTTKEGAREPTLSAEEKTLIAVGAAIAAGCRPCLERTVQLARGAGASERSIRLAIETALEARARQIESLAEWAETVQGGKPEVDDSFRPERAQLVELITCGSALALRDAKSLPSRLAGAVETGSNARMIASALAIARSVAETATSVAEEAISSFVSRSAADPVPCCGDVRRVESPSGGCSCDPASGRHADGSECKPGECWEAIPWQ